MAKAGTVVASMQNGLKAEPKGEANEGNGGAFQIEIPVASIRSPPEMSVITSRFIDMAYAVRL